MGSNPEVISEMELRLRDFYLSFEPETTQNFQFAEAHLEMKLNDLKNMFVLKPAVAGQLLIIRNTDISCACVRYYTPYTVQSSTHAPRAEWLPTSLRIPLDVHQHLANKVLKRISANNAVEEIQPNLHGNMNETSSIASPDLYETVKIDLQGEHVWNFVAKHALCNKVRSGSHDEPRLVETRELWGIYLLPSYTNHSCIPNCHRMRVGNAMFIRAATNISAGEEITLPYFDIFEPLRVREIAAEVYGFRCECRRCTFERSLGEPYDDIQVQVIDLNRQLQTVWNLSDKKWSFVVADRLLEKLASLVLDVTELILKLRWESSSEGKSTIEESWINASFIDTYIAYYTVCQTRPNSPDDPFNHEEPSPGGVTSSLTPKATQVSRVILFVEKILEIIEKVHPGSMLGQEFVSILLKARSQMVGCDFKENMEVNIGLLYAAEARGLRFCSRYYGFPGAEALLPDAQN